MTVRVGDFVPAAYEAHVLVFHHEDDDGGPDPRACAGSRFGRDIPDSPTVGHAAEVAPARTRLLAVSCAGRQGCGPRSRDRVPCVLRQGAGHMAPRRSTRQGIGCLLTRRACPVRRRQAPRGGTGAVLRTWWPDDRAWVVGTAIDRDDTLRRLARRYRPGPSCPDLDAARRTADDQVPERAQ
jgi:hypothetical protein